MTRHAYRALRSGTILYVMPYENDEGRRVVYRQDPATFDTTRGSADGPRARTLVESGRRVSLAETPAWCDPDAPAAAHATARPA